MGIEPTSSAWKAEVLPLNYTRLLSVNRLFVAYKNPDSLYFLKPSGFQKLSLCLPRREAAIPVIHPVQIVSRGLSHRSENDLANTAILDLGLPPPTH